MTQEALLAGNTSFSALLPGLQLAVDSTSLGEFKTCPRKYFYSIVCGYQPKARSFHLSFGLWYHGALERYDHARCQGLTHDESLDKAVAYVLEETWDRELGRAWMSGDANKNRMTLLRTVIDYADKFGENDVLKTVTLANGKPAVELSFSFFAGVHSKTTGEPFVLCGHMDRIAEMDGTPYISDRKTTSHTISAQWFAQFTPHNQFSLYDLAGKVVYKQPIKGLIVDGAQIAVGFTRFERGMVNRSDEQRKEWHQDLVLNLELMENYAKIGHWPQNDTACGNYGGCPFRPVCSRSPSARQLWLDTEYVKRTWDPLQRRGDI